MTATKKTLVDLNGKAVEAAAKELLAATGRPTIWGLLTPQEREQARVYARRTIRAYLAAAPRQRAA